MPDKIKENFLKELEKVEILDDLDSIYRKYLGKKGKLTLFLRSLRDLSEKERKEKGRSANQVKNELEEIVKAKSEKLSKKTAKRDKGWLDVTAPGIKSDIGHLHPITLVQKEIENVFQSMGFSVVYGPEAETEYYNFDALNIPKDHPARDLWDTFWLKDMGMLLRTHTSPMQARYMEKNKPPLRIIVPGRCFRHEATDASHDVQFYQVEGLMVGDDISVANFKAVIDQFFKRFLDKDIEVRLRPSYFPFVEPGFEVDVKRKGQNWLEIMGAGMVHPNVFKAVGYSDKYQGFAFGVGLDRLIMVKHKINDIRLLYSGDLRVIKQF